MNMDFRLQRFSRFRMNTSFPLQRLPLLAFIEVVENLSRVEKLYLAVTSQKIYRLMKQASKPKVEIDVRFYSDPDCILIYLCDGSQILELTVHAVKDVKDVSIMPKASWSFGRNRAFSKILNSYIPYIYTFWNDFQTGCGTLIEFLKSLFTIKYASYYLKDYNDIAQTLMKDHGFRIYKLSWETTPNSEAAFQNVLNAARKPRKLELSFNACENFRYDRFNEFRFYELYITHASWVTLNNLYGTMKCRYVGLRNTIFTSQDLNLFINFVMENDTKTRKWEICNENNLGVEEVMDGFERQPFEVGYLIRKPNGVEYYVWVNNKYFRMKIHEVANE